MGDGVEKKVTEFILKKKDHQIFLKKPKFFSFDKKNPGNLF
jgi:hypothetical protein